MTTPDTLRLTSFDLASQDIATVDVAWLHALSIGVEWPHRASDWDMLRSLGHGVVALDEIGRVFSSGMWFPHGEHCATIGMVITSPRVQTHGGGRWMMRRILDQCGDRRLVLNSTRAAYQLYVSLDFVPEATVYLCQGYVLPGAGMLAGSDEDVTPLPLSDLREITALDRAAFGAERPRLIATLAEVADAYGIRRDGRLVGYAMRRPFGRGQVIGPIVAESEEDAIRLVAPLLRTVAGTFVRIDTRQPPGLFQSFLLAAGLALHDTVKTLTRGGPLPKVVTGSPGIYGLAAHALS